MLVASSTINRSTPGRVTVTTSVRLSGNTPDLLRAANEGVLPEFDLASVVSAVTGKYNVAEDYRTIADDASYPMVLLIREEGAPVADGFLEMEADALAPMLVLTLETLLYDIAADAHGLYGDDPRPPAASRFSWGPGGPCVAAIAPTYAHPYGLSYNNTNRVGWTTTFSADGSKLPEVVLQYNGDGDDVGLSLVDGDGAHVRDYLYDAIDDDMDNLFRALPGAWPENLVGVHGVDTRVCHIYITGARIAKGSTNPGASSICQLDMQYATTRRYNMVYAEAVYHGEHNSTNNAALENYPYMYALNPSLTPSAEQAARLAALAAILPTNSAPPSGPPFYRDDAAYGRPINLFNVPDTYFATRQVYIPGASDNLITYNAGYFDPGSNDLRLGDRIKLYQKLVLNGAAWNPTIDMQRLATALFYPPQQYVFDGLQVESASDDSVAAASNLVTTRLHPFSAPALTAWKLAAVGRVNANGTTSDSLFLPATWHEANGYGLELLGVVPWKFKAPSSVSRTYPASIGEARSWYNTGEGTLQNLANHTVTAVPARMPFPAAVITTGLEDMVPIVAPWQATGVFRVPYKVADVYGVRPGVRPSDVLTAAKAVPLLRENQSFDLVLKCAQHSWRTVRRSAAVEGDEDPFSPGNNSYFNGYADPSAPFWGPTTVEATITAGGCSVNCGGT